MINLNYKYNYVVFGNDGSLMRTAYRDCMKCNQAKYIEMLDIKNSLLNFMFKYHTSPRINAHIRMPFRTVWNGYSFRNDFNNHLPICFIFFGNDTRRINNGLIEYLRGKYKGCKIISFCQDLVKTYGNDFDKYKKKFDYIFSFDHGDAQKYDLLYYPLVYSKLDMPQPDSSYRSDVYFLGKAKDRLEQIIQIYEHLSGMGLNCHFYITGVNEQGQKYPDKIHYCEGFSYEENIKHIIASKCLVEIMQGGGLGYTIRYAEALTYQKKIITNNKMIKKAPFFNDSFICAYDTPDDINEEFFNTPLIIDAKSRNSLSPLVFFKHIDDILE